MRAPHRGWARLLPLAAALAAPAPALADSLLELPDPDPLATLEAAEALPLTRSGALVYPAPGLPALIRPGEEIVARVRVRRAMTPPPGVQQPRILAPWAGRLLARGLVILPGARPWAELPLEVVQIRPENEGSVYRLRLGVPPWALPGVYDLEVTGPGLRDVKVRSVRVLGREPEPALELPVVASGAALRQEAEALWLAGAPAVLVPGGLLEAERALARTPVATFAVPAAEESRAYLCVDLEAEVARAAAAAAGCSGAEAEAMDCLVRSTGGAGGLERCGDELISWARRAGPPSFVVGLGSVSLVGLPEADGPAPSRAIELVRLRRGGAGRLERLLRLPATLSLAPSPRAARLALRDAGLGRDLLLLAPDPPASWSGGAELRALIDDPGGGGSKVLVVTRGEPLGPRAIGGPATVRLERVPPRPRAGPEQVWGLDPARYELAAWAPREQLQPAGLLVRPGRGEALLSISIAHPPSSRLELGFVAPASATGYRVRVEGSGRRARIAAAAPASGDPCRPDGAAFSIEVDPGPEEPLELVLSAASGPERSARLVGPGGPVVVGRPARFEVVRPTGAPPATVAYRFGDGASALGPSVEHRYLGSGEVVLCALPLEADGTMGEPLVRALDVLAPGDPESRGPGRRDLSLAVALVGIFVATLLLLPAGRNIVGARRR